MTGVRVHGWVAMSNHIHVIATDLYGERPRFMELLDAELAKAASSLIGRWGGFWEPGRSYSAVELLGVVDTYRDSDAIMAHFANVGELLGALGKIAPITEFKIYGNLSDEVRQATEPFNARYYGHLHGFTR